MKAEATIKSLKEQMAEATEIELTRDRYGYRVEGDFLRRVTTMLQGVPKPWLGNWAAKVVAEYAVEHRDKWQELPPTDAIKLLKGSPWTKRDDAGVRGAAVHEALEKVVAKKPLPDDLNDDEKACVEGAREFLDGWMGKALASELTVFNRTVGYAGTLDLWCLDNAGHPWIVDFKTSGSIYTDHAVQQAAYYHAEHAIVQSKAIGNGKTEKWTGKVVKWGPKMATRVGLLHVTPEGSTLHPINMSEMKKLWEIFRAAAFMKLWQGEVDDFAGKTPKRRVFDEPYKGETDEQN